MKASGTNMQKLENTIPMQKPNSGVRVILEY